MRELFPLRGLVNGVFIIGVQYMETIKLTIESVLGQFSIRKNICNGFKHRIFINHEFKMHKKKSSLIIIDSC